ncbi:Putative GNAT domain, acyl-CoA N-acyltransferase [Colletotrichum destructivum]|uniref:GNAT domain, acyl-CoA N-acyltransferase n=1 Tax=Colletotrichum destructivum TaxID=34406 RepID=A0AAX4J1G6_9PEZI|nr:Putative GNAT domain, acyl-CoA N-acyltransferase [Colletotrichum destructivum]
MGPSQLTDPVTIEFPPVSAAERTEFVHDIVNVVNKSYTETEGDIFLPGYQRTSPLEVADLIRTGRLAVAFQSPAKEPVGCVSLKSVSPTQNSFAMLALSPAYRGLGLGKKLVQFVEEHSQSQGCKVMQLELLVPTTFEHPFKRRIQAWYSKMGYQVVKVGQFEEDYPAIAPLLAGPAEYRISEKALV